MTDAIAVDRARPAPGPAEAFVPTWCAEVELSTGTVRAPAPVEPGMRHTRLLVRLHRRPLGYLSLDLVPGDGDPRVLAAAWASFGPAIAGHLADDGVTAPAGGMPPAATASCPSARPPRDPRSVSVVVCTRDRPDDVARCLATLQSLPHPSVEIVIVDNAPSDERTRRVVERAAADDPRVVYTCEPVAGASRGRNRGLALATGEIVAFADDDVVVDEGWLDAIVSAFADDAVGCVTGLVCTARLSTPSEAYFDSRTPSWSTRAEPLTFGPTGPPDQPLYPFAAGLFGTGANFSFRRETLLAIGGFDPRLGPGVPCKGGEDLDAFVRVIRAGRAIRYEPAAIVWHFHRREPTALRAQMYGYGLGLSAFFAKALADPAARRHLGRHAPAVVRRIATIHRGAPGRTVLPAPPGVRRAEFRGYLAGAFVFARSARRTRRPGTR